ncbi:MAG: MaoC family dehydratase [Oscillospiraceae bacterium]
MSIPFYIPYEDLAVGQTAWLSVTITEEMVNQFSALIGDTGSFHVSDEAAAATDFGERIVHGVHLLAYVSVAIGQKLPGFGTVYCSHTFDFQNPVYLGDTVTVTIRLLEKLSHHRLRLDTEISRGDGAPVMRGSAVVKTYR